MNQAFDLEQFIRERNEEFKRIAYIVGDISLHSFIHYPRLSEETYAFSATVRYKGKKVGNARNEGRGGCTDFYYDQSTATDLCDQLKASCTKLRIDEIIDELVGAKIREREQKKFALHFDKLAAKADKEAFTVLWLAHNNGNEEITSINTRTPALVEKFINDMIAKGWSLVRKA